jgi:hypothetical protein
MPEPGKEMPVRTVEAGAGMSQVSIDKRAEFFRDFMTTVLSLSTGAIVFSVTFLHDVVYTGERTPGTPAGFIRHSGLLTGGWLTLLAGVVASLIYLFFHALSTKYESAFSNLMTAAAVAGILGLLTGLFLLVLFAMKNLPA